jgi:hypothetical protein
MEGKNFTRNAIRFSDVDPPGMRKESRAVQTLRQIVAVPACWRAWVAIPEGYQNVAGGRSRA